MTEHGVDVGTAAASTGARCTPPGGPPHARRALADAVARSSNWAEVMRALGMTPDRAGRTALRREAAEYGLDTAHFTRRSPWRKYPDAAIAEAVARSRSLREVACALGARPATGTLSHLSRRIDSAGIDVGHFPGLNRPELHVQIPEPELRREAARCTSTRALARALGLSDDAATRAALRRTLDRCGVDVRHFSHSPTALPEERVRAAVAEHTSVAAVVRALGLPQTDANWRRVRRLITRAGWDTSHFRRRPRARTSASPAARARPEDVLRVTPATSSRTHRSRLRRALDALGVAYACGRCGNGGSWLGEPLTLHIDHVNGDWHDNRRENLRYLCPNCHALTATWCGRNRSTGRVAVVRSRAPGPGVAAAGDTMPVTGGGGATATQQV
ncbi:HNH endonuclease signature motif containing protein [Streptomyces chumphonensis]|uniref:HNH endonuclease signature motif containing protein n=1 Tax=Streptomyces chumphonensis TaxID=1214925 RepID=UPI001CD04772|nr:HNH endonuclease signature motif containing protein [Streptomyces chumphonensis]